MGRVFCGFGLLAALVGLTMAQKGGQVQSDGAFRPFAVGAGGPSDGLGGGKGAPAILPMDIAFVDATGTGSQGLKGGAVGGDSVPNRSPLPPNLGGAAFFLLPVPIQSLPPPPPQQQSRQQQQQPRSFFTPMQQAQQQRGGGKM